MKAALDSASNNQLFVGLAPTAVASTGLLRDLLSSAVHVYGNCKQQQPGTSVCVIPPPGLQPAGHLFTDSSTIEQQHSDLPAQPNTAPGWLSAFVSEMEQMPADRTDWSTLRRGQYGTSCVGGTFDDLHLGHKLLLTCAALLSRKLVVGVTDEVMLVNKACGDLVKPLAARVAVVEQFVRAIAPSVQLQVLPISDAVGPAVLPEVDALVVSDETFAGVAAVNTARAAAGAPPLAGVSLPLVPQTANPALLSATEEAHKLSSSAARADSLGVYRPRGAWWCQGAAASAPARADIYCVGVTGGIG